MEDQYQVPVEEDASFDDRFAALEHQCYLMYLQLNAITQLLVQNDVLKKEDIGASMDSMHGSIVETVSKLQDEEKVGQSE
jgi:hypothetical protein